MKTLIATALVAVGLLSTVATAQADADLIGYPAWAQEAFSHKGG